VLSKLYRAAPIAGVFIMPQSVRLDTIWVPNFSCEFF
jgi:hypothetical protein